MTSETGLSTAYREPKTVRAWDLPTRLFHWTLVFCIISAWVSFEYASALGDPTLRWHRWNGMAILVLLVFRLLWGFVGGTTSRFSSFVKWPWTALAYLKDTFSGRARHFLGHNPAGSWMIIALIAAVMSQALLGLFTLEHNDLAAGPLQRLMIDDEALTKQIQKLHAWGFNIIIGLAAIHVTVNALYHAFGNAGFITAMVTGRKRAAPFEDHHEAHGGSVWLALACLGAAMFMVFGGITLAGGRLL